MRTPARKLNAKKSAMFEALIRIAPVLASSMRQRSVQAGARARPAHAEAHSPTLKGNAALMGLGSSPICATSEDELASRLTALPAEALAPLERAGLVERGPQDLPGDKGRDVLELSLKEVEKLAEEIRAGAPTRVYWIAWLWWWRVRTAAHAPEPVCRGAGRLGKGEIEVEIEPHGCAWRQAWPASGPIWLRRAQCGDMAWRRLPSASEG